MANNTKSKLKTLVLRQILEQETDADHGLTMPQILQRLEEQGIPAERKAIYRDLNTLREFGLDVQTLPRKPVEYAIVRRDFTLPQLMLLVDAVESCQFLTQRQARAITTNLKLLASDHQREQLNRQIHVTGRATAATSGVFEAVDTLHEAMRQGRQARFMYYRINGSGKRQPTNHGKPHQVTPVAIAYTDSNYYLTAWNDTHQNMTEFRIDRMGAITICAEAAAKNSAIAQHRYQEDEYVSFGRFGGDPTTVTFQVAAEKAEIITDRFGKTAQLYPQPDGTTKAVAKVRVSPQFFGWLAGLDNAVRIESPHALRCQYHDYLKSLIGE